MGIDDQIFYICKYCGRAGLIKEDIQRHEYQVHLKTPEIREQWKPQSCFIPIKMRALYLSNYDTTINNTTTDAETSTITTTTSDLNSSNCSSPHLELPPSPLSSSSHLFDAQENIEPTEDEDDNKVQINIVNDNFDSPPEIKQEDKTELTLEPEIKQEDEMEPILEAEIKQENETEQIFMETETKPDHETMTTMATTIPMTTMRMMRPRRSLKNKIEDDTILELTTTTDNNQNVSKDQPVVRRSRRSRVPKTKRDSEETEKNTSTTKRVVKRQKKLINNSATNNNNSNRNTKNKKSKIISKEVVEEPEEEESDSDCPKLDAEDWVVQCDLCKKRFKSAHYLVIHMKTHTGERPYKCTECNYATLQGSALTVHMRVHSGEKPYACKFCNKKFSQSGSRLVHERNHTNEKPYVCKKKDCKKAYTVLAALVQHQKFSGH